jgi:hypothetical protein
MGGELVFSNGIIIPDCGPSIVWADDSAFLAVPQWQPARHQRLLVVSIAHGSSQLIGPRYSVLELSSFARGTIRGVDSPAHNPTPIEVDAGSLHW